jgi:hypothetical protein
VWGRCAREREREREALGLRMGRAGPGVAHAGRRRKRRGEWEWAARKKEGRPKREEGRKGRPGWAGFSSPFTFPFPFLFLISKLESI